MLSKIGGLKMIAFVIPERSKLVNLSQNPTLMRRLTLIPFFAFFLIAIGCSTENCEECKEVTYDSSGNKVSEGSSEEYCGEELEEKKDYSATVGNQTKEYECS